jgi:uncharacterized protein involved in exopolysaccharide biosynthesis
MPRSAELQQKAAIYAVASRVEALLQQSLHGRSVSAVESAAALDVLQRQQTSIQKNLDDVGEKLTIARRGETLERNQQAERLEVIEQPIMPTTPVKGNRLKLLVAVLFVALAAGAGAVFVAEIFDRTVRGPLTNADVRCSFGHGDSIYFNKAEALRRRTIIWGAQPRSAQLVGLRFTSMVPLDELWDKILLRLG